MDVQDGEFLIKVSPNHDSLPSLAPTADIVFVHGLNPLSKPDFARATWTHADGTFWPAEHLGQLLPGSRIFLFSYNSRVASGASTNGIKQHANSLLVRLAEERPSSSQEQRPIIFVPHSLGGLVVKQALVIAKNDDNFKDIREATTDLVFFAVPHRGGHGAQLGRIAKDLVRTLSGEATNDLVESLCANSLFQEEQAEYFRQQLEDYRILAVVEARETVVIEKFWRRISKIIVDRQSATLGLPGTRELVLTIDANHLNVCRIAHDDLQFKPILSRIKNLAETAPRDYEQGRTPETLPKSAHDCLRSLAFPQIYDRFQDIDAAANGTCKWLIHHDIYKSWEACDQGLLWIKGKPGSGKSTLLKCTLENCQTTNDTVILSFFFHGRGNELQKTPLGLFRSLLHQALGYAPHALPDLVDTFVKRRNEIGKPGEKWQWHPKELYRFFKRSIPKILETHSIWLFVDALDECGKENAVEMVDNLKSLLDLPPASTHLKQLHICFSCRHYPILNVDEIFEIVLEKESQNDISTFVNDRLSAFSTRMSSEIPTLIAKRASGVFLWAHLVVKKVLDLYHKGYTSNKIEAMIYSVPPDLDQLYEELSREMGSTSLKLIQWICFATRPLSIDELRWAMAIDANGLYGSLQECQSAEEYIPTCNLMKRQVQTLSCGLAEVTIYTGEEERLFPRISSDLNPPYGEIVQFIHHSVKDYFIGKGHLTLYGNSVSTDVALGMAHSQLCRICLRYLKMEEIGRSTTYSRNDFPFLHYATTSWMTHAKESNARGFLKEELLELLHWPSEEITELWARIYRFIKRFHLDVPPAGTRSIHTMATYGIFGPLIAILQKTDQIPIEIDSKDGIGNTPLSCATRYGHRAIVELLLGTGKVEINSKNMYGYTPLSIASKEGHETIVQLLLKTDKVEIDSKDMNSRTPLTWAARNGHKNTVQLLLQRDKIEINSRDISGKTPLSLATENGHKATVQLLLDTSKAEIDSKDMNGRTPLSLAAGKGHRATVQLLLDTSKVEIDSKDMSGRTPLTWAARNGHEAIVQLLFDTGKAELDSKDEYGKTPLAWAAKYGHGATIKLLLNIGKVEIDSKDGSGKTPLAWATKHGQIATVQLLLDTSKVEIDSKDINGRTPLTWAAENGNKTTMQLLLNTGRVDVNSKDIYGRTPLTWAAKKGQMATVQLLLDTDKVEIDSKDDDGQTPLSWAADNGQKAIVRLLLSTGKVDINSKDIWGRTPLSWALISGRYATAKLLKSHGASPS